MQAFTPYRLDIYRKRLTDGDITLQPIKSQLVERLTNLITWKISTRGYTEFEQLGDADFRDILERLHDEQSIRASLLAVNLKFVSRFFSIYSNQRASGKIMALVNYLGIEQKVAAITSKDQELVKAPVPSSGIRESQLFLNKSQTIVFPQLPQPEYLKFEVINANYTKLKQSDLFRLFNQGPTEKIPFLINSGNDCYQIACWNSSLKYLLALIPQDCVMKYFASGQNRTLLISKSDQLFMDSFFKISFHLMQIELIDTEQEIANALKTFSANTDARYNNNQQHDVVTFYGSVLAKLNDLFCIPPKWLECMHIQERTIKCSGKIAHTKLVYEASYLISLPMPQNNQSQPVTYEQSKQLFEKEDELLNLDCKDCQQQLNATLSSRIMVAAQTKMFTIHNKFFSQDASSGAIALNKKSLSYPEYLELALVNVTFDTPKKMQLVSSAQTARFKLVAAVTHYGDFSGGHYIALGIADSEDKTAPRVVQYNDRHITTLEQAPWTLVDGQKRYLFEDGGGYFLTYLRVN